MAHNKIWSQEELDYVRDNYPHTSASKIAVVLNRSRNSVKHAARKLSVSSDFKFGQRLYSYNQDFFAVPNRLNSFYAGFIGADGCIQKNNTVWALTIKLAQKDRFILERFKEDYAGQQPIIDRFEISDLYPQGSWKSKLSIWSANKWKADLESNFGIIENKTYRIGPPNLCSKDLHLSYILGYMCGDGCVSVAKNTHDLRINISSCSILILKYIESIFDKYFPSVYHHNPSCEIKQDSKSNVYLYKIGGMRGAVILDYLNKLGCPKFDRKLDNPILNAALNNYKSKEPQYFVNNNPFG